MKKYRKKPVVVEAMQITDEVFDVSHSHPLHIPQVVLDPADRCVFIRTLEGEMRGDIGDWIIKGVKGEYYPCKPDVFDLTYEAQGGPDGEAKA